MATLESDDSNILDAQTINWRLVVYPLVAAVVLVLGGFGYYYYLQSQRDILETQGHDALVQAKTPEDLAKVADQFPGTHQATLALSSAANNLFAKKDYAGAIKDYQRIIDTADTSAELRDSAQLGLASTLEADGKGDDAIKAYLAVAHRGKESPYAPFAYHAAAEIYDQQGNKEKERDVLMQAVSLGTDSPFLKQAEAKLKALAPPVPVVNTPPAPTPVPAKQP